MPEITKIETLEDFRALEAAWGHLVAETSHTTVYESFAWLHSWWQSFGPLHRLYLLVIRTGDQLVGIAPLMLTDNRSFGFRRTALRFMGTPEADYCDFIGEDKTTIGEETLGYLLAHSEDWDTVDLSQVSERSPTVKILQSYLAGNSRYPFRSKKIEVCPVFQFAGTEQERATFKIKRDKNTRTHINFFEADGPLVLEDLRDPATIRSHLFRFFHYHVRRWNGTPHPSRFLDNTHRAFFRSLVEALSPSGHISFLVLKYGRRPIAFKFNFHFEGTIYYYTPAHSLFYAKRSPGIIAYLFAQEHYVKAGCSEINFVRGEHMHKEGFVNAKYTNYQVAVFRHRTAFLLSEFYDLVKNLKVLAPIIRNRRLIQFKTKVVASRRALGAGGIVTRWVKRGIASLVKIETSIVMGVRGEPVTPRSFHGPFEYRRPDKADIEDIATFYGMLLGSTEVQRIVERLDGQSDCFAAYVDGCLGSIGWTDRKMMDRPGLRGKDPGEIAAAVICDLEVSPVLQDTDILEFMLSQEVLFRTGQQKELLLVTGSGNKRIVRLAESLGFSRIRALRSFRILGYWI